MNIGIVYHGGEFPPAERIEKEARSLIKSGHQVFVLCNNYGNFELNEETFQGIKISRLKPTLKSRTLNRIIKFPIFLNPLWLFHIFTSVKKHKLDVLHVVDIPLGLGAWFVARLLNIKVVLDMWENYPEALKGWGKVDWKTKVFKNYRVAKIVESITIKLVDHVIVVVEEQADRLVTKGVHKNKITVVTNTVDLQQFPFNDKPQADIVTYNLLYVGVVTIERGLEDLIRAFGLIKADNPLLYSKLNLIIAGDGNYKNFLNKLSLELNVSEKVQFPGWVKFSDIPMLIENSYLCLVPHLNNEFINTTIPNKIFQYMALAKPILVSNAEPLKRIITDADCGYIFTSGDPKSAKYQIENAVNHPDLAFQKGLNGRSAAVSKYNWNVTELSLLNIYGHL